MSYCIVFLTIVTEDLLFVEHLHHDFYDQVRGREDAGEGEGGRR